MPLPRTPDLQAVQSLLPAAVALLLSATGATTQAQSSDCPAIADDGLRLACYDRLHGRAGELIPPGPTSTAPRHVVQHAADGSTIAPADDGHIARQRLGTNLTERWELDRSEALGTFLPRPYKPVYVLPLSVTDRVNHAPFTEAVPAAAGSDQSALQMAEAKFQLSLKSKAIQGVFGRYGDLWFGYTQTSRWQVYNGSISRPFRETNYEPEAMLVFYLPYELLGWQSRQLGLSLNHQSNGRSDPLSRSWNRVIGEAGWESGNFSFTLRPWWRVPEKTASDDNPGIADYIGRGEALLGYRWNQQLVVLQARHSLRGGERAHGSAQLEWSFPVTGNLNGHLQLFHGYGDSLIDYNFRQTRIGLGVSLVEWL
jgi:phospholipase A1